MPGTISIAHNAVNAKLVGADRQAKLLVREALSYLVDGAEHTTMFKSTGWDGTSSFFDFNKEHFPRGFINLVHKTLVQAGYTVQMVRKPFPAPRGAARPVVDAFGDDPRYEYQHHVYEALLRHGQIIAQIATGGGKSRVARLSYKRIGRTTLFLTTRGILMYQMRDAVADMGEKVGVLGDDQWSPMAGGFNVAMVQTLAPLIEIKTEEDEVLRLARVREEAEDREVKALVDKLRKQKVMPNLMVEQAKALRESLVRARKPDIELVEQAKRTVARHTARRAEALKFLETVEFVIAEEAHEISGDGFYNLMRSMFNAHYRLALTATPFMKDSAEANMRLQAVTGDVAVHVTEEQLINLGVLARPYFQFVTSDINPPNLYRSTPWPRCYELGVVGNAARNHAIVYYAKEAIAYGMSVMVLVGRQSHGKELMAMFSAAGIRSNFIFGEHNQEERQAALNALKADKIEVLIGSTILDVGVDVPAIGMIIMAGGGKAEVQTRQRIGRGLRRKPSGPNVAFVVDFADHLNNTLREHARMRRQIIEQTPGFREGIVPSFNYEALGFTRKAAA